MGKKNVLVSASILGCDLSNIESELKRLEKAKADYVHFDVMDGVFVNNISFGIPVLKSAKTKTYLPFDVHLMIIEPEKYISEFANAGADIITFHLEATKDIKNCIDLCKKNGCRAGLSIKPNTPATEVFPYLELLDMILVMTVEPGFGGQGFLPFTLEKVKEIRQKADEMGLDIDIQVDGGITDNTCEDVKKNGANILVAGTYLFRADDISKAIESLR